MADFRTPLGRARGLGSAKHGVGHFIGQRVSAIALVVLMLWGVWAVWMLAYAYRGYEGALIWLHSPMNATLMTLLAAVAFYHMWLGMSTIVEDYIHRPATKAVLLIANTFVCFGGAALTVLCVLMVAFARVDWP